MAELNSIKYLSNCAADKRYGNMSPIMTDTRVNTICKHMVCSGKTIIFLLLVGQIQYLIIV